MRSDNRAAQLRKSPSASQHFRRDMALSASESIRPAIEKTTSSSIVCFGAKEIRHYQGFTEDDEIFIEQVKELLLDGALPRPTTKKVAEALKKESDPLRVLGVLRRDIPSLFFQPTRAQQVSHALSPREVILSSYIVESK